MISIQKMIRTTLSVRVSRFRHDQRDAEGHGRAKHDQVPRLDRAQPRPNDDDDADKAKQDRGKPRPRQLLAEEGDREQRRPDRGRELDRDQLVPAV